MPVANWPSTLPQAPLLDGYARGEGKAVLRSDMEAGPAKVRRRFTATASPLQYPLLLRPAQLQILRDFWRDDLAMGALAFELPDPQDSGATLLCRFTEEPSWTAIAAADPDDGAGRAKMYRLSLQLEILP